MLVIFKPSENGPLEEAWYYKGYKQETWYYYYDEKGRLTDIARYNPKAKKTLPDYIFEYDEDGDLSQQTVVMPITNFYRVWVYEYQENGLKKAESILKKGKEQEGRIIYSYDFWSWIVNCESWVSAPKFPKSVIFFVLTIFHLYI